MKKFRDWKFYTREEVFLCKLKNESMKIRIPHKKFGRVLQHWANIGILEILDDPRETVYYVPMTFYVCRNDNASRTIPQGKTVSHNNLIQELCR